MAYSLALSLLLHVLLVVVILESIPEKRPITTPTPKERTLVLHRTEPKEQKQASEPQKEPPYAKTNPDLAERRPERKDFVGKRNARAASSADAPKDDQGELPGITGETEGDLVTFDQTKQDGDLMEDGKQDTPSPASQATEQLGHVVETGTTMPDGDVPHPPTDAATTPRETPHEEQQGEWRIPPPSIQEIARQEPQIAESGRRHPIAEDAVPLFPDAPEQRHYRDPSLASHSQPGFRTTERKSRVVGRFIMGRHAALNVEATPRGRYSEEIYRRIAYWWYRACDDHRGDIIPGKIVVSLRLNKRGQLVNMDLIQRSGAGVIQQSFTFGAIRQASLPPMPPAVQEEMVGELMEMIIEFNFD